MSRLYSVYGYREENGELRLAARGLQTMSEDEAQANADERAQQEPDFVWCVEWRELQETA